MKQEFRSNARHCGRFGSACAVAALFGFATGQVAAEQPVDPWQDKVHPLVLEQSAETPVEFFLFLADQARPGEPEPLNSKVGRTRRVFDGLREHAQRTQAPLIELLEGHDADYRSYWIANMIWVRGDPGLLATLARRPDVLRIDANPRVRVSLPEPQHAGAGVESASAIEWNLTQVNADVVWAMGYEGKGIVVGGQDTGYGWTHPALIGNYRGWNGVTADHDYNWHDAIHSGGGSCGPDTLAPCDDSSHGTHTMGTMVGDDGGVNRIGMAPRASWIGCRNMDRGVGTPLTYIECFQWFVAPTDRLGLNPEPAMAPDVINNSWLCPPSEGCSHDSLRVVVENVRAAGIVVVASAGNAGPSCGSVYYPPAIYDAAFSVGATSSTGQIASFSSRGPVAADGSGRMKPDISAPGVGVRSSVPPSGYGLKSGTSMAGPHVAGLVALLLSARPDLRGHVDEIEKLIETSAVASPTIEGCGDDLPGSAPNNTFGHGRIDAEELLTGDADGDLSQNLADCSPLDGLVWSAPSAARDLTVSPAGGVSLNWLQPLAPGCEGVLFDVLRGPLSGDFSAAECAAAGLVSTTFTDGTLPASDSAFYLVRARNGCGSSLGSSSVGPRDSTPSCP